jgi:VanZ family protein
VGGIDKIEHFLAYTVLAFLLGLAFNFQSVFQINLKQRFLVSFILSVTYAILDEVHQIPIPGRYFDWWDLFSDFIGILIGLAALKWFTDVRDSDLEYSEDGTKEYE